MMLQYISFYTHIPVSSSAQTVCSFNFSPQRELQAMEALQNGQTTSEGSIEGQSAVAASHAMIEKILSEEPRWQGACHLGSVGLGKSGVCGVPTPVKSFV